MGKAAAEAVFHPLQVVTCDDAACIVDVHSKLQSIELAHCELSGPVFRRLADLPSRSLLKLDCAMTPTCQEPHEDLGYQPSDSALTLEDVLPSLSGLASLPSLTLVLGRRNEGDNAVYPHYSSLTRLTFLDITAKDDTTFTARSLSGLALASRLASLQLWDATLDLRSDSVCFGSVCRRDITFLCKFATSTSSGPSHLHVPLYLVRCRLRRLAKLPQT